MPKQMAVSAAQFRVSPLKAHDPGTHGARVGQEYQAGVRVELTQVFVELLLLQLLKPEIQLPLHGFGTVAPNQISSEANCTTESSHRDRYIPFGVADRVEHLFGHNHHRARLQAHRRNAWKISEPFCQLLVLRSVKTVSVSLQGLRTYAPVAVPSPLMGPADALRDQLRQRYSQLAENAPRP